MPSASRVRLKQVLREAEGYLELQMPHHALSALKQIAGPEAPRSYQFYFLEGEARRALEQYNAAIASLERAADLAPSNIHVWVALGWCYKRTGHLDLAIQSLERAIEAEPDEALLHYNLACYWSLAGNKPQALEYLSRSFTLDPGYRDMVAEESDFDPLRSDPDFQALTSVIV